MKFLPLSRDRLMSLARGREHEAFERSMDVTIARLRRLLALLGARGLALRLHRLGHDALHRLARVQRPVRVLEHHLEVAPRRAQIARRQGVQVASLQQHLTGRGLLQRHHQPRLLAVDNEMVVPVGTVVRMQVIGQDVILNGKAPMIVYERKTSQA